MKNIRLIYLLFPLIICCSCRVTNFEMPIADIQKQAQNKPSLKEITVGLGRPQESRNFEYKGQDYSIKRYETESFLNTLKKLDIFGDVDYYDKLPKTPDLVIDDYEYMNNELADLIREGTEYYLEDWDFT